MRLRHALSADEPSLARLCARAFFNDDLFGRVIHPHRSTYPNDVDIYWHEALRENWSSPRSKILVAVSEEQDDEKIIGLAIWERQGVDAGAQRATQDFSPPGPWPALQTHNHAVDPSKKSILKDAEPFIKHYWAGPRAMNWYLALCCVDPEYQRGGCGRLLVGWGLKRAREEGVSASVIASDGNSGFYLACGFDEIVGNASRAGGEANPLMRANVQGGDILFAWLEGGSKGESV